MSAIDLLRQDYVVMSGLGYRGGDLDEVTEKAEETFDTALQEYAREVAHRIIDRIQELSYDNPMQDGNDFSDLWYAARDEIDGVES